MRDLSSAERTSRPAAGAHPSTAAFRGHPLHPAVVPLPIGMLTAAAASDLLRVMTGDRFFTRASQWLVGGGVASGVAAAALGIVDLATIRAARRPIGFAHAGGNVAVLTMSALSLLLRLRAGNRLPLPAVALTTASAALLFVTGWLGGELTFRHRIGVAPPDQPSDAIPDTEERPPRPSQAEGER